MCLTELHTCDPTPHRVAVGASACRQVARKRCTLFATMVENLFLLGTVIVITLLTFLVEFQLSFLIKEIQPRIGTPVQIRCSHSQVARCATCIGEREKASHTLFRLVIRAWNRACSHKHHERRPGLYVTPPSICCARIMARCYRPPQVSRWSVTCDFATQIKTAGVNI